MSEINIDKVKFAGIIFGDGYITKNGNVCFRHSVLQKEYADYKSSKLFEYFGLKTNKYLQKKNENSFSKNDNYTVSSHSKNWTKILRDEWYINSIKNIPPEIISNFKEEEWSFIYMDDGRLNKISHYNAIKNGMREKIFTDAFVNRYEICLGYPSDEVIDSLIFSLKNNMGIDSSILVRKDGQKNISISKKDSKISFYEKILKFIHSSMKYKIETLPVLNYLR